MQKPDWWPENPYPQSVFPMPEERYPEIVPDPDLRTALSGMLGRRFWAIASEMIWEAMQEAIKDGYPTPAALGAAIEDGCPFCGASEQDISDLRRHGLA